MNSNCAFYLNEKYLFAFEIGRFRATAVLYRIRMRMCRNQIIHVIRAFWNRNPAILGVTRSGLTFSLHNIFLQIQKHDQVGVPPRDCGRFLIGNMRFSVRIGENAFFMRISSKNRWLANCRPPAHTRRAPRPYYALQDSYGDHSCWLDGIWSACPGLVVFFIFHEDFAFFMRISKSS